jgi:hypothetical protein
MRPSQSEEKRKKCQGKNNIFEEDYEKKALNKKWNQCKYIIIKIFVPLLEPYKLKKLRKLIALLYYYGVV